ncbi:MAG: hypothetical protein COU90_02255 [Candidatus Ryanbacteria bacterium CG10_big_fil_rev_8_21_14_0_10_43_42]|uniref:Uncharacterized protein n=1 Tax=Candidatus Ryanbacteria bacterium CG10_big_fil_rev_8_21_14_0_10_43_42 TaxID=1974864 RepID=A0A2M8KXM1_9BACT|nr:MAG: hypothetical protein COU90_02255 [Candidatus Ryanbacteria bacterium CG10_big_fil_rev_8_21_14_0_10_43_42]
MLTTELCFFFSEKEIGKLTLLYTIVNIYNAVFITRETELLQTDKGPGVKIKISVAKKHTESFLTITELGGIIQIT